MSSITWHRTIDPLQPSPCVRIRLNLTTLTLTDKTPFMFWIWSPCILLRAIRKSSSSYYNWSLPSVCVFVCSGSTPWIFNGSGPNCTRTIYGAQRGTSRNWNWKIPNGFHGNGGKNSLTPHSLVQLDWIFVCAFGPTILICLWKMKKIDRVVLEIGPLTSIPPKISWLCLCPSLTSNVKSGCNASLFSWWRSQWQHDIKVITVIIE